MKKTKLTSIAIISDVIMTKNSEQQNNVKWVFDLISRSIELSTGIKPSILTSSDHKGKNSRKEFFEAINIKFNPVATQLFYNFSDVNEKAVDIFSNILRKDTFYICYELSKQTRELMDKLGYVYLDIWLHPIRFMDDVLFAFKSNSQGINKKLSDFNINPELYYLHASYLKVQSYKGFKRSTFNLEPNSAIFIGQTLNDKAIFQDGKMLRLTDFKKQFELLVSAHKKVYYSRHPFVKSGDEDIIEYISQFKNVELIDKPAYEIISRDEIVKVATISSSVAYEAKYFGKEIEYYFEPPVKIDGCESYYSIYNQFSDPSLWERILSIHFETKEVQAINFANEKDKLRDTLSFYWGYRNIDKLELLKITVGNLFKKKGEQTRTTFEQKLNNPEIKVVSFDIFDTLVKREVGSPRDIFRIVQSKLSKKYSKAKDFYSFRVKSEILALQKANNDGREDTTLDEIYEQLSILLGLDNSEKDIFMNTELELERLAITARVSGKAMYDLAIKSGKTVILTSDMYLSAEFLTSLLNDLDITEHYKLYVSSEYGLRKHEGSLYRKIIEDFEINGENILHVGDNLKGDIESASNFSIDTFHIPRAMVTFENSNPTLFDVYNKGAKNRTFIENLFIGQYINRYFCDSTNKRIKGSKFNKSKEEFGYMAMGPFIISFANWIYEESKSRKFDKLLFLSRDGKIVMDVYNILFSERSDAPQQEYVFASRRASKFQSIRCDGDLNSTLSKFIYSTTVEDYLSNNFGLSPEDYSSDYLLQFDLTPEFKIGNKFSKDILRDVVFGLKEIIFEKSKREREVYKKYLLEKIGDAKNVAVVDIGYAGTMQSYMSDLLQIDIKGLYFVTFNTAIDNVGSTGAAGYLGNLVNPASLNHTIATHRFIYEGLICSDEGSFIGCKQIGDSYEFAFDNQASLERAEIVREIHKGIILLANDLKANVTPFFDNFTQCGLHSTRYFDAFILKPSKPDTMIVEGVEFFDAFGPTASLRVLVPSPQQKQKEQAGELKIECIWKEGYAALKDAVSNNKTSSSNSTNKTIATSKNKTLNTSTLNNKTHNQTSMAIEGEIVLNNDIIAQPGGLKPKNLKAHIVLGLARITLPKRKYLKLVNKPDQFFSDSNSRLSKAIEHIVK
ncbi:TPA: HAD-IA family hydrolase [Yersinia enterocolitica]